jgi:CelD/BcsL family acetyltransferase involved in cellulose biosynthesis
LQAIRRDQELPMTGSQVDWLSPDEEGEWDAFVARHPRGIVYHLTAWQRILEAALNHIRGRFLVLRDRDGQIQAGLPLYTVSSWLLGNRTVSVPFATMCDPLVSTKEEFDLLWPSIQEAAKKNRSRRIEIRTWRVSTDCTPEILRPSTKYKHHYLPLSKPVEDLFRSFDKTSIRQRVEQARRAGVVVEERQDEDSLRALHSFLVATRRRRSLPPMPFAFFQAMCRSLGSDRIALYLATKAGEPVAGHLVLKFKGLWTAEYSGTPDSAIRGSGPLLYWETIQLAKRSGAECFSFGRTSLDNAGLLDHKRRWGTIEEDLVDLVSYRDSRSVEGYEGRRTVFSTVCGVAVQLVQRYAPARVQKQLGDFVYRHLG